LTNSLLSQIGLDSPDFVPSEDEFLVKLDDDRSFDPTLLRQYAERNGDGMIEVRAWLVLYLLDRSGA
jgi:hypothetical protein